MIRRFMGRVWRRMKESAEGADCGAFYTSDVRCLLMMILSYHVTLATLVRACERADDLPANVLPALVNAQEWVELMGNVLEEDQEAP